MRIMLKGKYKALENMLKKEGEDVVEEGEAELVIGEDPVVFPLELNKAAGFHIPGIFWPDVVVSRFYDNGWRPQTLIGFPLTTLMDGDLSCPCEAGMAMCFTNEEIYSSLFTHPLITETIKNMKCKGFVSMSIHISDNAELGVWRIQTGIPFNGFFNILESVQGRLSQFLCGQEDILQESWTVNLLLSRYPYPHEKEGARVYIEGLNPELEKHLFLFDAVQYKNTIHTETTEIGTVTAWSQTLSEVARRVLRTLRNVQLPLKQHRTDLFRHTDNEILRLQKMGMF